MAGELLVGKSGQTEGCPAAQTDHQCHSDVDEEMQLLRLDNLDDQSDPSYLKPSNEEQEVPTKLCGYLNKLGGKGPLKGCKTRWFVYNEKNCHLYYFRTAQDVNPLGSIDLSHAAFIYSLETEEGTFEIRSPEKDYTLKAKNRQTMMYWLQQLQQKRFDRQRSLRIGSLTISREQSLSSSASAETNEFLDPVKTPTVIDNVLFANHWGRLVRDSPQPEDELKTPFSKIISGGLKPVSTQRQGSLLLKGKETGSNDKVNRLQYEVSKLSEDLASQKELVRILHKALEAAQQEKRTCNSFLANEAEAMRLELLRHKVRQIAELQDHEERLENEKRELELELKREAGHVEELKQHVQLLMEKNNAKQEVVLKLSAKMAQENEESPRTPDRVTQETLRLKKEIAHLKDDQEAYKTQNKFLNSEIYHITKLWQSNIKCMETLALKCAYLEAKYCQIESKYLVVLHKLQDSLTEQDVDHHEMLKQLIEDALHWESKEESVSKLCSCFFSREYDEYGFKVRPDAGKRLTTRIRTLELKSNNLISGQDGPEKANRAKWDNLIAGRSGAELIASPELKNLIRNGVPKERRRQVWKWCVRRRVWHIQERYGPNRYKELLKLCQVKHHPASKQIELDLLRTLTNNKHFTSLSSEMVLKLRRVLLAYSWQNPDIGYCQGLNRLAAIALLILPEEDAFWCLVAIVDCIMPEDYYSKTLIGSQGDQRVFRDLLSDKLPRLTAHFEQHNVDLSLITFNWFLVMFVDCLKRDILLGIWDAFLYEGTKVLFRYGLAIFKYNEEEILKLNDNLEIYENLRSFPKNISDCSKLRTIAFVEMNPFPMRLLKNRRAAHLEKLRAELSELERIREEYVKEREEQKGRNVSVSDDEEET
uniref:TBC1 domain family member 2 n=1 Tax=Callorhinchus milii TaxID=7868 RepID=A0A4W3I9C3_CALMI